MSIGSPSNISADCCLDFHNSLLVTGFHGLFPERRPVFINPIHLDVKPATGTIGFSSLRDGICSRTGVRDGDYTAKWKVAHGYISGRSSSQKRGAWVRLLAPFQKVSKNRLHKPHNTNNRISSIWPYQNVDLRTYQSQCIASGLCRQSESVTTPGSKTSFDL